MRMRDCETSSDMSQITVDSAEMVDDQGRATPLDLDYPALDSKQTEWTNEKHYLYLKAMEASFVSQLHFSMGLCKGQAHKCALDKEPPGQFKTLRDGSWKNVSLYKYGNKSEAKPSSLLENPCIRRFRRTGKNQVVEATISQDIDVNPDEESEPKIKLFIGLDSNSKQLASTLSVLCRQDSVGSNTEMSGQNFDSSDEVMNSNIVRRAKRKKTDTASNSDNDQVVPSKVSLLQTRRR